MNEVSKPRWIAGWLILVAVAGMILFAGVFKLLLVAGVVQIPPQDPPPKLDMSDKLLLLAIGEISCAVLLLVPRTSSLGVLAASGFWGGTIAVHLAQNEPYFMQSAFLLATWLGAWLRDPMTLSSFYRSS